MNHYVETRDAKGRTIIEMPHDSPAQVMIVAVVFLGPLLLVFDLKALALSLALGALIVTALVIGHLSARKRMRITIDPHARTLGLGTGTGGRVFPFAEVARAQLNSRVIDVTPQREAHRIDLVLRSGETLPTIDGWRTLSKHEHLKVIDRINAALGVR